ncbi:MAG: flagellar assembly protein FliW [Clostridiales bacterium]|jgi:flagellar assembly factor FliW|nr:flagellar assembly protein FliW [Clostridiales bacterium]
MKLDTRHFGEIDVDQNKIIEFKEGVPGFSNLNKFVLLAEPEENSEAEGMFYWLQSVEDPSVAFVMVNMVRYMPEYNPLVEETEMNGLGDYNPDKFVFYNIAVVPENISDATVNLRAPVVINDELKLGKQVICTNDEYTVRHYLFK